MYIEEMQGKRVVKTEIDKAVMLSFLEYSLVIMYSGDVINEQS